MSPPLTWSGEARAVLTAGPTPSARLTEQLLPLRGAARQARKVATAACARWGLPHLTGPAVLLASELITHAALTAGTLLTLTVVHHQDVMYVAVRHGPAVTADSGDLSLLTVDAVASHWGYLPQDDDVIVWAALGTGAGRD
jgi:hypothetical protein